VKPTRRALLLGAGASLVAGRAAAMGRVPTKGQMALRLPWSTERIDPHDLADPLAAILGSAIADPVYARKADGTVYPTLADGMPQVEGEETVVTLRAGLRSGRGRALGGRDLAWSATRCRKMGAVALFTSVGPFVRSDKTRPLIARFGKIDPTELAILLSSPLCALLPVGFSPTKPDGTGGFVATLGKRGLELTRNRYAARGPSQLEKIQIAPAVDLADSLRAFEAGTDDIGWLGMGYYSDRPDGRAFDYGNVGWVVLCTGKSAGSFHAGGMAQKLADAVPAEQLHVGLRARANPAASSGTPWSGGAASLLVDASSPHLREVADAVAAQLSQPGHSITVSPVSRATLRRAREAESFHLAIDVVRDLGFVPRTTLLALATAESADRATTLAKNPRASAAGAAHTLTTTHGLHLGVLGALPIQGGMYRPILLAADKNGRGIDWSSTYRS
jgi:peptide/nickel transport system substrate-binding protein